MIVKYIDRIGQIVILENGESIASCEVFRYGDRWQLFNMRGKGILKAWPSMIKEFEERGARYLSGYVSPAHARALRMVAKKVGWDIEIQESVTNPEWHEPVCWVDARKNTL